MNAVSPVLLAALAATVPAQQWSKLLPADGRQVAAYDLGRARTVLFASDGTRSETWSWNGGGWTQLLPATSPNQVPDACTHDLLRDRLVLPLFGPNGFETWEYDGTTWSSRTLPLVPPGRREFGLAYDLGRGRVVLFGGIVPGLGPGPGGQVLGDTWEFDGNSWFQVATPGPSPRRGAGMIFDLAAGRTLLFGGTNSTMVPALSFNDTWTFDGTNWTNVTPPVSPGTRAYPAMASDFARHRVVMFGGVDRFTQLGDTWEYSGTWQQIATPAAPSPRAFATMVYDTARQVCVMQGGAVGTYLMRNASLAETWEYDGVSWSLRVASPSLRQRTAAAFDSTRDRVVLFGGSDGSLAMGDTWLFGASAWTRLQTSPSPAARSGHAMVHDPRRGVTWLFGGITGSGALNDTWWFDGSVWAQANVPAAPLPTARWLTAMAYDSARARIVLFGGLITQAGVAVADTWEFNGSVWAARSPVHVPPARSSHAMGYDARRGVTVLFGGQGGANRFGDTWEFDGLDWIQATPAASPNARTGAAMAYDCTRARILLCGGLQQPTLSSCDLWTYDGQTWQQLTMTRAPGSKVAFSLAYDCDRGQGLTFDGSDGSLSNETLFVQAFAPAASFARYGIGCTANGLAPVLDAAPGSLPSLGTTFTFALSGLSRTPGVTWLAFGFDLQQFHGAPLPIELGVLGLPGCLLWNGPDLVQVVVHPGAAQATASVAVPSTPALAGLVVGAQAITFDNNSPNLLGAVTNGSILRLQ